MNCTYTVPLLMLNVPTVEFYLTNVITGYKWGKVATLEKKIPNSIHKLLTDS